MIFIPQGSINSIITYLDKNKTLNISIVDKYILALLGSPQSGWIDLYSTSLTKYEFLLKITKSKAAMVDITLIPGETLYFFISSISTTLNLDPIKLYKEYHKLSPYKDGVILANTYKVPLNISEAKLMHYLLSKSIKKHKRLSNKFFGSYDEKKWFKYIIISSIIQKEAASIKEMPLVSAVIFNRLKKKMKLQMDGTLNYGKYSHTKITPKMIKEDKSSFNTYKNRGIPLSAVGAVSIDAIKAAIYPAKVKYLYFMKNKKGTHDFSNSYKKHLQYIKSVQR